MRLHENVIKKMNSYNYEDNVLIKRVPSQEDKVIEVNDLITVS